jgi:hypothetical protein
MGNERGGAVAEGGAAGSSRAWTALGGGWAVGECAVRGAGAPIDQGLQHPRM